jgi:hypothetical protein
VLGILLDFVKSSSNEKIAGQLLILHKINRKYRKKNNDLNKQLKEKDEMIETLKHTIENQSKDKF